MPKFMHGSSFLRAVAVAVSTVGSFAFCQSAFAQVTGVQPTTAPAAATAPTIIPALIRYSAVSAQRGEQARAGDASVAFLVFKDEKGGEPLWTETQMVSFDSAGRFEVYLGASSGAGLPADLFSGGEARWLEVQIAGSAPEPRALLTSVPYAMKAADAATLGGLPASAFQLAGSQMAAQPAFTANPDATSTGVTTPGGKAGYLSAFSGASTIDDSILYQSGTRVGINTTAPASTLDINGATTLRGALIAEPTGTATSSTPKSSQPIDFTASTYNSSTKKTMNPIFALQAEGSGNNTATPSGTLNLLYSTGATPAETGLSISSTGVIKFVPGQTFPSTSKSGVGLYGTDAYGIGVQGVSSTSFGVQGTSSTGTGVQGVSNSSYGVEGTSYSGPGMLGYTAGGTLNTGGVVGQAGGTSGFGGIAGVWGDAPAHVGVLGTSNQYSGVQGLSTSGPGVQGQSTNGVGVQGSSTYSNAGLFSNNSPSATLYATNSTSNGGTALYGVAQGSYGIALYASETGTDGTGVEAFGNGNGVIGDTSGQVLQTAGVLGVAGSRTGVSGIAGVWGDAQEHVGVIGSSKDYSGVYGASTNSYGVQASSTGTAGVYGVGGSSATSFSGTWDSEVIGVWGDTTGVTSDEQTAIGGTASNGEAAQFSNNSQMPTVLIVNYSSGSTIADTVPFRTLQASTPDGTCGFGDKGNLTCTGQLKSLATTGNGARTVETYSMQSPENWMEDFGSGKLSNGTTTVSIDAAFAETVSGDADYHVFLTPRGDSKGLYMTNATPTSFGVHESGGGTSTISFDYRIVAKRRGFEAQRMVDVTDAVKVATDRKELRISRFHKTHQQ